MTVHVNVCMCEYVMEHVIRLSRLSPCFLARFGYKAIYTVESLYTCITDTIGNQHFVQCSGVSLTQRLTVYFQ